MLILNQTLFLSFTFFLFCIGIFGMILNRKSIVVLLMSLELMFLASNLNLIFFAFHNGQITGHISAIYILTIAGAEAAIGLAILIAYFRLKGSVGISQDSGTRL